MGYFENREAYDAGLRGDSLPPGSGAYEILSHGDGNRERQRRQDELDYPAPPLPPRPVIPVGEYFLQLIVAPIVVGLLAGAISLGFAWDYQRVALIAAAATFVVYVIAGVRIWLPVVLSLGVVVGGVGAGAVFVLHKAGLSPSVHAVFDKLVP